jgi:DNA helicase-2/ATP-dependent DNA helicase PcrA
LRLANRCGRRWERRFENRLIPSRALMALDSFRQLLLDAQAMMDPDFAGKLAMDVAGDVPAGTGSAGAAGEDEGTDFGFGAAAEETAGTDFNFGNEDEGQIPLLDASHFSPFHAAQKSVPKKAFLKMPETTDEKRNAQVEPAVAGKIAAGMSGANGGDASAERVEGFRAPATRQRCRS